MLFSTGLSLLSAFVVAHAFDVDPSNLDSVKDAALKVAPYILNNYTETNPKYKWGVGRFGPDTFWWEAAAVWTGFIDYWAYTGDTQFNDRVAQGLLGQVGPNDDYLPPNETTSEGNDEQALWGLAALTAAERKLPQPSSGEVSWQNIAVKVFNAIAARWDRSTCGGGLQWQIFTFNAGNDYKNAQASGFFYLLAARLAQYTGNQTYADWATQTYDWSERTGLVTKDGKVYDGFSTKFNCSIPPNNFQWSYNAAAYTYGSIIMANITSNDPKSPWSKRSDTLFNALTVFFGGNSSEVLNEVTCESDKSCRYDEYMYKAVTAQWLGEMSQIAVPNSRQASYYVPKWLNSTARAAADHCMGSNAKSSNLCDSTWVTKASDGNHGVGQQMSAFNVFVALLAQNATALGPANSTSSGANSSSTGTSSAGTTPTGSSFTGISPTGSAATATPSSSTKPSLAATIGSPMVGTLISVCVVMVVFARYL